jgi:hypothetical protein
MALLSDLADALSGAAAPRDLMLAVSYALQPVLPHEAFELLVSDSSGETLYRLGLHGYGPLWADPALVKGREWLAPEQLFGERHRVFISDVGREAGGQRGLPDLIRVRGEPSPLRSLVGVKLKMVEREVGYLLLGSIRPLGFRPLDLGLLESVGAILAPRVDALVLSWRYQVLLGQFDILRHVPMHLSRTAELLALTPVLGEGTRLFAKQAEAVLTIREVEFAVRLKDESRFVAVKPGFSTPLTELPPQPLDRSPLAPVVRGEISHLVSTRGEAKEPATLLAVPLRAGGRIFGAMSLSNPGHTPFSRTDLAVAQALADLIAPHLDLARRSGGTSSATPPPGLRRPGYRVRRPGEPGKGGSEE